MYLSEQYYRSQQNYFLRLHGNPVSLLLPLEIEGHEILSEPFYYEIKCLSNADYTTLSALQGQMLCCEIGDDKNHFLLDSYMVLSHVSNTVMLIVNRIFVPLHYNQNLLD